MTEQYFEEIYSSKDTPLNYERFFVPAIGEPLAIDLIRRAALTPGERVLDVACGTGIVGRLAWQRVGETGSVSGLDIDPGMLAVARSVTPPEIPIEWHEANAEVMPLPDEVFDVVLCQLSLQFMKDKIAAVKEMKRVLKPGGRAILNVPGPAGDFFAFVADAMEKNIGPEAAGFVKHVFSLHDLTEIQQILNSADFGDIEIQAGIKTFNLPEPKEFLWQYVRSTPLAEVMSAVDERARTELEKEVTDKWKEHVREGTFTYDQRIVTASAQKYESR